MKTCMEMPLWGQYCVGDLNLRVMGYSLNLLHPGVITTLLLGSVIVVYVFRDPT